ncbi:hypothetical protein N7533_001657 [Penicillium manginii]|jgi:hypothetical protein|uniref:uncharacterized protein n=1 Tax=Penicillium manginii TaxID=203109 RepID=UPI0025475F13|nr:uncharacterized protein N7533_001657 [Penicillium manginii]KAJ5762976.1 hypothetical protein N7533_001657 [Penicillium manginii]
MTSQASHLPTLDHLVVLVSFNTLENLSSHLQDLFTVAPGGKHSNGLTSNKLVLFQDGVYIEFIAFYDNIDPEKRRSHRWGNLRENSIIDWAFTYPPNNDFNAIRDRVASTNTQISYEEPAEWSRERDDGVILEWTLSTANGPSDNPISPGQLPFWCLDTTPRSLRVPYKESPHLAQHPSGVRSVASLALAVDSGEIDRLTKVYEALSGPAISGGVWGYSVPEGPQAGTIALEETPGDASINLTLSGLYSKQIEPLPGLVFEIKK